MLVIAPLVTWNTRASCAGVFSPPSRAKWFSTMKCDSSIPFGSTRVSRFRASVSTITISLKSAITAGSRCAFSLTAGPAAHSPGRAPSDGTMPRARATSAGSTSTKETPTPSPASASTSPQGETARLCP